MRKVHLSLFCFTNTWIEHDVSQTVLIIWTQKRVRYSLCLQIFHAVIGKTDKKTTRPCRRRPQLCTECPRSFKTGLGGSESALGKGWWRGVRAELRSGERSRRSMARYRSCVISLQAFTAVIIKGYHLCIDIANSYFKKGEYT